MSRYDLCGTFRTIAYQTWDTLARTKKVGLRVGEESFTDFNLLEIMSRHPDQVITKTFTKRKEGLTGADWEWWFRGKDGFWIGFLVQAKVIDVEKDSYEHIHYPLKNGGYQIDRLLNRALTSRPLLIPLYCLYSYWQYDQYPGFYNLTRAKGPDEAFGCSIVNALSVLGLQNSGKKKKLQDLLPHMAPWRILVCNLKPGEDLAMKAFNAWRFYLKRSNVIGIASELIEQIDRIETTSSPPEYVHLLLKRNLVEPPDENLKYITVFQQVDD